MEVMREVKPRIVSNIQEKFNPAYVTKEGDTIFKEFWVKSGDSVVVAKSSKYVTVEGRLIADYTTTAEK